MASFGRLMLEMFARAMGVGILVAITGLLVIGFFAQSGDGGRIVSAAGLFLLGGIGIVLALPSEAERRPAYSVSPLALGRPLTLDAWRAHDALARRSAQRAPGRPTSAPYSTSLTAGPASAHRR